MHKHEELGHKLYKKEDFTQEEIMRENIIAVMVINEGRHICKVCGEYDEGLDTWCKRLIPENIAERIEIDSSGLTECWVWRGEQNRNGYGRVWFQKTRQMVHRVIYRLVIKKLNANKQLDHTCCNRLCVRPSHLEQVTNKQNSRRRTDRIKKKKSIPYNKTGISGTDLINLPDNIQ